MGGARCLRMEDRIGSLTPGKQADVILLRRDRIGMMSGAEPEQVAVLQANGRDVDTVLIAGEIRKQGGVLLEVDTQAVQAELDSSRHWLASAYRDVDLTPIWRGYERMIAPDESGEA